MNYDDCHCSSEKLGRQQKIIRNMRELEALKREREGKGKEIPSDYLIVDGIINPKYLFDPKLSPFSLSLYMKIFNY